MDQENKSIAVTNPDANDLNGVQKLSLALGFAGLFIMVLALVNINFPYKPTWLFLSILFIVSGIIIYSRATYKKLPEGIKNNGVYFKSMSGKGVWAWGLGIILTVLYVFL